MSEEEEEEEKLSISSLFLSQISQFCCLIISHPLYFSYILFFSPHILKVLSFFSPLLTITFLILLLPFLFTFFSHNSHQHDHYDDQLFLLDEWFNNFFNTIQFPLLDQEPEMIKKEVDKDDDDHVIIEKRIKSVLEWKVFEDEEEKMDLLWEKYEEKELVLVCEEEKKDLRSLVNQQKELEEEEEEENGKICCLQALKFSTSKMRFGMGKKSAHLKKISKAFKGLKFLHQLTTTAHRKNNTHS